MRILVTGATGFLGSALVTRLRQHGHDLILPVRRASSEMGTQLVPPLEAMSIGDWRPLLEGTEAVIHCAALAHISGDVPSERYVAVNRDASVRLATAAAECGVRRMVFVSSIRAQVGATSPVVQRETTPPAPTEAYGESKLQAERLITAVFPMATHLRPPLIVGGQPRANLALLARLAASSWPLPFGACRAPQAAIARDNLVDAILLALVQPPMQGETYVLADEPHPSIADMLRWLREGRSRSAGLIPVPETLLRWPARIMGKGDAFDRIAGGLAVDSAKIRAVGWNPRVAIADVFRMLGRNG